MSDTASVPAAELAIYSSWIGAYLTSVFVELFMDGLYTALMMFTVLTIASLKQPHTLSSYVIYASIFVLYAMCMIRLGSWAWYIHDAFINHVGDALAIFTFFETEAPGSLMRDIMAVAMTFVADLILVWRVFALWGSNWKVGLLPLILTLFGLAFGIQYIFLATNRAHLVTLTKWDTDIAGIYYGSTLGNTIISTLLILFRVLQLGGTKGLNRYWRFISLAVESAALYSVILIIYEPFVTGTDFATHWPTEIVQSVVIPMTGIAPTLLVVRVILSRESESLSRDGDTNRSSITEILFSSRPDTSRATESSLSATARKATFSQTGLSGTVRTGPGGSGYALATASMPGSKAK